MTERPILFSGPMVRAILAGAKTMTRRVVKPQPDLVADGVPAIFTEKDQRLGRLGEVVRCPYGVPGDRLWVREALRFSDDGIRYEADGALLNTGKVPNVAKNFTRPYRPPMLMPRWASRLTLEVLNVRVERLQEIGERDVRKEGCELREFWMFGLNRSGRDGIARSVFRDLWDSLNAERGYGWVVNPFVWVVEFRRIER